MNRSIASLALVKAMWDTYRRDYIENFVPFIATLIKKKGYTKIAISDFSYLINDFYDEFGLRIPYHPMETILERARKRGIINRKESHWFPNMNEVNKHDFSDRAIKKEAQVNQIVEDFIGFCKSRYNISLSDTEALNSLQSFLMSHDLDVLFASQNNTLLEEIKTTKRARYLLNTYINYIKSNNPLLYSYFIEICTGHILANTILYKNDFNNITGSFRKVGIYLDSGYIIRLLGMEGDAYRTAFSELTTALNVQESNLFIFRHTYDEVQVILQSCLHWLNSPQYDSSKASNVLKYFIAEGKSQSDLLQYISTFDEKLLSYKISITPTPEYSKTPERQIDETKLRQQILKVYGPYFNEQERSGTIDKDIKSISAIHHLRKVNCPQTLKTSGQIFITTNKGLAYANKLYEQEECKEKFYVPVCLTDVFVGTIIWMQSPIEWMQINEKKIIADCISALQPDAFFIKKVIDEAKKLKDSGDITQNEYVLVREGLFVQGELMEKSLGDPDAVNTQSVREVLQKVRSDAAEIPQKQYIQEKTRNEMLSIKLEKLEKEIRERTIKNKSIARWWANVIAYSVIGILLLVVIIVYLFAPYSLLAYIMSVVLSILSVSYGFNILGIKKHIYDIAYRTLNIILEHYL